MNNEEVVKEFLTRAYMNLCYAAIAADDGKNVSGDAREDYKKDFDELFNKLMKDNSSEDLFRCCLNGIDFVASYVTSVSFSEDANLQRKNLERYLSVESKIYGKDKPCLPTPFKPNFELLSKEEVTKIFGDKSEHKTPTHTSKETKKEDPPTGDIDFDYE